MPHQRTGRKPRRTRDRNERAGRSVPKERPWVRALPVAIALIAVTLAVYSSVRHFQFVNWDDPAYITENPNVLGGLTWRGVVWALTTGYTPYWHPVTWLSHLLDVQLFGLNAGAHHVTSLLIHAASSVLLFGLLRAMTGAAWCSAFVAAVFAVHPLHVESVAWVTERKDVLSGFWWVLTLWAYVRCLSRPGWRPYLAVLAGFALALMSKPMVVTLPVVLLLLDFWPLKRGPVPTWSAVRDKIPLFVMAFITGIVTILIQRRVGAVPDLEVLTWSARLNNALIGYVAYIGKAFWPTNLAAFYPQQTYSPWLVAAAALALAAVSAAVIRYRRQRPYLFVGWAWYVITLAPVAGFVQAGEQTMADRFMYLPLIGLAMMVAWGVQDLVGAWPIGKRLLAPVAGLVLVLLTATARAQVGHWSDSVTLWSHAIRATDDNYLAHQKLGEAWRNRGQLPEALVSYRSALALAPVDSPKVQAVLHNDVGLTLARLGNAAEARAAFVIAVTLDPEFAPAQTNLGNAMAAEGRLSEAVDHYRAAVQLKPDSKEALVGLGAVLLSQGRAADAIPFYTKALELDHDLAEAHNGLGGALAMQGHDREAIEHYAAAVRIRPTLVTAHYNLGLSLSRLGRVEDARRHLEAALEIDPGYEPARRALAQLPRKPPGV